jgi:quercetin dioxygenase-like cupin family protein
MKVSSADPRSHQYGFLLMRSNISWASILMGLVIGFLVGRISISSDPVSSCDSSLLRTISTIDNTDNHQDNPRIKNKHHSFVANLPEIPIIPTSHPGITKQVLLQSFEIAKNVAALSVASINPGQMIETHHHPTMFEFFYILSGEGRVTLTTPDGGDAISATTSSSGESSQTTHVLKEGVFLQTAPGDYHSFTVDSNQQDPLRMIYFGITTD